MSSRGEPHAKTAGLQMWHAAAAASDLQGLWYASAAAICAEDEEQARSELYGFHVVEVELEACDLDELLSF